MTTQRKCTKFYNRSVYLSKLLFIIVNCKFYNFFYFYTKFYKNQTFVLNKTWIFLLYIINIIFLSKLIFSGSQH